MSKNVLLPLRMLLKIYALFTHVMDSPELYFYILKLETRLMRHWNKICVEIVKKMLSLVLSVIPFS